MVDIFIPVKKYTDSKERLSAILSSKERALLAEKMAQKTVNAFLKADINSIITLVTNDPGLSIEGAKIYVTNSALNIAIHEAIDKSRPDDLVMVTHADLPRINAVDIESIVKQHIQDSVTIISDDCGIGTNSLLFENSIKFNFKFGPKSFALFKKEFAAGDISWHSPQYLSLQQDLDSSDDYFKLIEYIDE